MSIAEGVTTIGDYAFCNCTGFNCALIIPSTVTYIGQFAFFGCSNLSGALTIPSGVTTINQYTFCNCSNLSGALTIPSGVTTIGKGAFAECSGLTGTLNIPSGVTAIGDGAFFDCSGFSGTLTIPSGITSIGNSTFQHCTGFTGALNIPSGVTYIDLHAFYNCSGLNGTITIPSGVTYIGEKAFYNCSGLTGTLDIPGVTTIGENAFEGCSSITTLTVAGNASGIDGNAFYGWTFYDTDGSTQITNMSNLPGYTYSGSITQMVRQSAINYTVTIQSDNTGYGTVSPGSIANVPYGSIIAITSNTLTVNGTTVTATPAAATAQYTYSFSSWSVSDGTVVTDDVTVTAYFDSDDGIRTVTYDTVGGSAAAPVQGSLTEGTVFTVASYSGTKTGFSFGGWNDGSRVYQPGSSYAVGASDITFTAVWNPLNAPVSLVCSSANCSGSGNVSVTITLADNPGISVLRFSISYDGALQFVSAAGTSIMTLTGGDPNNNPYGMYFETNTIGVDTSAEGLLATLTFSVVAGTAEGTYAITIVPLEASNDAGTEYSISVTNGSVTVTNIPGDLNGDGRISGADSLLLRKYIAGWSVTLSGDADFNNDGNIDSGDSLLLRKYLAGWNIILG